MDAEDLLLRQFLGIRDERTTRAAALFIRGQQRPDGTWVTFYGGPAISPPPSRRTSRYGWPGTTRPSRTWRGRPRGSGRRAASPPAGSSPASGWHCSAGGKWEDLPEMPPEIDLLPEVDAAQHLRLRLLGPADDRAADRGLGEAPGAARAVPDRRAAHRPGAAEPSAARWPAGQLGRAFQRLDRALHAYRRVALQPLRRAAMSSARPLDRRAAGERRLLGRHPAAGRLLAHRAAPARLRPGPPRDAGRTGVAGPLRRAGGEDGEPRMIEACQSPVWDTCLADHRARRRGRARRPPRTGQGRRLDAR